MNTLSNAPRGRSYRILGALFALLVVTGPAFAQRKCVPLAVIQSLDQAVDEGVLVSPNGTPSQDEDTYLWQQVSGSKTITFLPNATVARPSFVAPEVDASEVFTIRLTVTGCGGVSHSTTSSITIRDTDGDQNSAPIAAASASPSIALEGQAVDLVGVGSSDPDGDTLGYAWTQVSGTAVTLQNATSATASFVAPNTLVDETLVFNLHVSDGALSDDETVEVTVSYTNDPPHAVLTCAPSVVDEGDAVTLDGSASSDYEDSTLSYAWSQTQGPPNIDVWSETGDTVGFVAPTLGTGDLGGIMFTLTVKDSANTTHSASCGIFIRDVTKPVIVGGEDRTVEATSPAGASVDYGLTATDNVEGDVSADLACAPPSGSTFALGTTAVACEVSDANGNTANASFDVTVVDTTAPAFIADPADVAVEAEGPGGSIVAYATPLATDIADSDVAVSCLPASGGMFPVATTTVTCRATDDAGNTSEVDFDVTVHDLLPPVLSDLVADMTVEATSAAGAAASWADPTALDLVDGSRPVSCVPASGSTFALGTTTVTCSASDTRGNAASDSFEVNVVDTTAPTLGGLLDDMTVEATSPAGATVSWNGPTAVDSVDGNRTVTCAPASGSTFALGTTTVTCSASDTRGNTASDSFDVAVVDSTPPALTLPGDLLAEATSASGAAVSFSATALDLVSGSVAVDCTPASGSTFALGATIVNCGATDAAGNTGYGNFTVTVRDTTGPTIAPHADVTATASGNSTAVVSYTLPTATDLVDGAVPVSCTPASGSTFNVGATTVTCTAQDGRTPPNLAQSTTFRVIVSYTFNGFFQPIDNNAVNAAKAGSAIPVKFALGGNQGLNIFAPNSPSSQAVACDTQAPVDEIETTVTAGGSTLQYDAATGQYIYVWKTEKGWVGCRQLRVTLRDGSTRTAMFKFR